MSALEIIAIIFLVALEIAGAYLFCLWLKDAIPRRKKDAPEQPREFNPCATCQRWGECNGVDRDNCPLWRDYDQEVQNETN